MEFYHTETNRDIHHPKADAISHGKKNKKFRIVDIAMPGDTRNVESREREREREKEREKETETREHKAREIRNKAFRELKKGMPVIVRTLGVTPEKKKKR